MNSFWKTWNSKFNIKSSVPQCIDGKSDNLDIAGLFASISKKLVNLIQLINITD